MDNLGIYQILRDNNKRRKYGYIVPGMGRWDNVSSELNNVFFDFVYNKISSIKLDNTLVIGLAESGLIAGYLIYKNLLKYSNNLSLALSTRENDYVNTNSDNIFIFQEDHVTEQHPTHFLNIINKPLQYNNIIIIDDEMTTGISVKNLIKEINHLTNNIFVFCYADVRDDKFNKLNIKDKRIEVYSMMTSDKLDNINEDCVKIYTHPNDIKIGKLNYNKVAYMFGECIQECIDNHLNDDDCLIRIITHINWKKAHIIKDMIDLGADINNKTHKYYNPVYPKDNEKHYFYYFEWQQPLVDKLLEWLKSQNKNIEIILISSKGIKELHNY